MNRYPTTVKTVQRRYPHTGSDHSRVAVLLLLLMAAFGLVHWLHRPTSVVLAQESDPVSPLPCFRASNLTSATLTEDHPDPGILLAWRTNITDTTAIEFDLARAQFTSADSELRGPQIPDTELTQLLRRSIEADEEGWRYTVVDTRVVSGTRYAYVLTTTVTISETMIFVDEQTWTYDDDPQTPWQNNEICLLGSTVTPWPPTPTRTPTSTSTPYPTDTATLLPPTHTATSTWTPTPTNTQPPSPIVWPTDTPYPSPTFTPLPTDTPIPPTPTETPTETPSPTFTPMISAPTPRFDANTGFNSQWNDPNSSIMPTPEWTPFQDNQPIWPEETPTPDFSFDSLPQEEFIAENTADPLAQEAVPAQAALMSSAESSTEEDDEAVALVAPAVRDAPPMLSEYRPTPTRDTSSALRLALYAVGALALLSALAFLVGALVLFGSRHRS